VIAMFMQAASVVPPGFTAILAPAGRRPPPGAYGVSTVRNAVRYLCVIAGPFCPADGRF
jgi:hypothetical protein